MASIAAVPQFIHTYLLKGIMTQWLLGDHPPFQINFLEIVMLFLGRLSPCGHTYYISIRNFRRVQDSPIFAAERRNMNFFLPMKKRSCNRTRLKIWPSLNSFFLVQISYSILSYKIGAQMNTVHPNEFGPPSIDHKISDKKVNQILDHCYIYYWCF